MSMSNTPISRSSCVSTASAAASCSSTSSCTAIPRFVHAGQHVLVVRARTRDDVDVRLQPAGGHAEGIVDAVLSIDDELARDHVQQLELGGNVDRLRRFDDTVDVFARYLTMLSGDRDDAARVDRADVIAATPDIDRFDLQPGH